MRLPVRQLLHDHNYLHLINFNKMSLFSSNINYYEFAVQYDACYIVMILMYFEVLCIH